MRIINKLERVAWLRYIFVVMMTATRMSWERGSTWFDFCSCEALTREFLDIMTVELIVLDHFKTDFWAFS